jgi:hypothetical protein
MALSTLFAPRKTSKGVSIFLALFCLLPFLSVYVQTKHLMPGFSSVWTRGFIYSFCMLALAAIIAYFHHQLTQRSIQAEQGAAANP